MSSVSKSAVVPYTAEQMYNLVNDIESYPGFLPWCTDAVVYDRTRNGLTASVSLATGKLRQTFTTDNRMQPGRRIDVNLVEGPFRYLQGYWKFEDIDQNHCRVELEMKFEFKSKLLKLALSAVFSQFLNALVGSFTERAKTVYG